MQSTRIYTRTVRDGESQILAYYKRYGSPVKPLAGHRQTVLGQYFLPNIIVARHNPQLPALQGRCSLYLSRNPRDLEPNLLSRPVEWHAYI